MIFDLSKDPAGAPIEGDLCVIGGGAAGIAIALRAAAAGVSVVLLESGGRAPTAEAGMLSEGSTSGLPYFALDDTRVRALGGSTFRWGARSAPMRDIDFERRDWAPMSGWPFGAETLEPYYADVAKLIGLRLPFAFDSGVFSHLRKSPPPFDASLVDVAAFQFGKNLIFGETCAPQLEAAKNVKTFLNASVTEVTRSDEGRRIESATVKSQNGKSFVARARIFILACGGIENARLLLNWGDPGGNGLCNGSGLVGRCFMEHPTVEAGVIRSTRQNELCDIFSPGLIDGRFVETGVTPSIRVQRESKVLNAVARARAKVSTDATQALREIIWNLKHRNIPLNLQWYNNEWLRQRLKAIARDPLSIPLNIIRHFLGKPKRFKVDSIILEIRGEQAPNPDSRVTLSDETDQFGLRRAHLHWEMTPLDKRTMRETAALFDQEIRRLGLGSVEFDPWITTDELVWPDNMVGGHHHMGATRMSDDPASGVVDADCKAHELDNLYVAGCSLFPTSSYVNPTFTMLCLAQRLADHVAGKLDNERKFGAAQGAHDDVVPVLQSESA